MQKPSKQNIIFIAGLHGNEKMPVRALTENNIPFVLGNPRAYKENIRFTKRDINASFGLSCKDYECLRAREILNEISEDALVVDFHTTASETRPFVIIVDEEIIPFAKQAGIERIVIMRHNIKKGRALINYRRGISVEAGRHQDQSSYETVLNVVRNIKNGSECPVILYEVYDEIKEPGTYRNFRIHKNGFIPILANEPAYERQGLFGLKARKM